MTQQTHLTQYETFIFVFNPQFGCKGHKYPDNSERRRTEAHPHSGQRHWHQGKSLIFTPHTPVHIAQWQISHSELVAFLFFAERWYGNSLWAFYNQQASVFWGLVINRNIWIQRGGMNHFSWSQCVYWLTLTLNLFFMYRLSPV